MEGAPEKRDAEWRADNTKEVLTLEEFSGKRKNGMKIFNNFIGFFHNDPEALMSVYRTVPAFKKFAAENHELETSLSERITEWYSDAKIGHGEIPEDLMTDLYEAYKIMISYEEIKSNNDLFK